MFVCPKKKMPRSVQVTWPTSWTVPRPVAFAWPWAPRGLRTTGAARCVWSKWKLNRWVLKLKPSGFWWVFLSQPWFLFKLMFRKTMCLVLKLQSSWLFSNLLTIIDVKTWMQNRSRFFQQIDVSTICLKSNDVRSMILEQFKLRKPWSTEKIKRLMGKKLSRLQLTRDVAHFNSCSYNFSSWKETEGHWCLLKLMWINNYINVELFFLCFFAMGICQFSHEVIILQWPCLKKPEVSDIIFSDQMYDLILTQNQPCLMTWLVVVLLVPYELQVFMTNHRLLAFGMTQAKVGVCDVLGRRQRPGNEKAYWPCLVVRHLCYVQHCDISRIGMI